jgi:hypothetical protein
MAEEARGICVRDVSSMSLSSRTRRFEEFRQADLPVWADTRDGVHKELALYGDDWAHIRQHPSRGSTCVRVSELVSCGRWSTTVVVPVASTSGRPCGYHPLCPNSALEEMKVVEKVSEDAMSVVGQQDLIVSPLSSCRRRG